MVNPFFKNHGPFKINDFVESLGLKDSKIKNNLEVLDINDLFNSEKGDITFFHSKKYKDIAQKTKASFCIITENLRNDLNKNCIPHWDLVEKYNLIDFELGNKITGSGFPVYKGKGATLQRALINYFLDKNTS